MSVDVNRAIRTAMQTGKVVIGSKRTIKACEKGEAKLVIVASNCPEEIIERIKKTGVPIFYHVLPGIELGAACGKPFSIAAMAVIDEGDSNILGVLESG
ncbi:MAG: large subunit ribosomal protein L30e [Archaeoglobi archaeon]|nr:50S ribosomal protein L30e [Candidatus Mnemosynella sp.]MBC7114172.1 50S ribosomal protein L30e [Candidatus Mnemosynella bozhongmuii]MDI3501936.1 large subunit ribosomal protein L30e [Archaeoglobi archaeon]MDK2781217.1 large subunit ribosomal protein L30e [Archaeoglobi archaeon]